VPQVVGVLGEKELALITARARDAVATFLSPQYLHAKVSEIERKAGAPVGHPEEAVRHVAKAAKFSDEMADAILAHFICGGQLTAGGVMQAVTSVAQTLDDADTAHDLEGQAPGPWISPCSSDHNSWQAGKCGPGSHRNRGGRTGCLQ